MSDRIANAAAAGDRCPGDAPIDLVVIGGGINGAGIARDAAGQGLRVLLLERHDLAGETSSASSKLIHGGLRYLEQREFRLVRESLTEREVLWAAAPHVIRPMRFVLPVRPGLRSTWLLRAGLLIYDHLGGRRRLPPTRMLYRGRDPQLDALDGRYGRAFEYSDCWADDARLVVLNALDAHERGACIAIGWSFVQARRESGLWRIDIESQAAERRTLHARALVNAAGPWVEQVLTRVGVPSRSALRLVKGSHIVVPQLYPGDHAYTLQSLDGRVIFTIPFQERFTLIGTTDVPCRGESLPAAVSPEEVEYLCRAVSEYFRSPVRPEQVVWQYAGVRPLYDNGEASASTVTRDYVFDLDAPAGSAPLLSVFGGKLTTYRRLAEHALSELLPHLQIQPRRWTRGVTLPGGDLPGRNAEEFCGDRTARYAFAPAAMIRRMCAAYGTRIDRILQGARRLEDLGQEIAPQLYEAELDYLRSVEWARSAEDVLWRRSKLGLALERDATERVASWLAAHHAARAGAISWSAPAGAQRASP
ncbi:MAG TPA: glycerol-3-phosphate dehydrogenase [Steroidobacteraceae bacterium]|nr:glycerol-3-phosphate dehydrogenase [Steroidobacteraceae bacterium]